MGGGGVHGHKLTKYKKVLLRERKRHTARRVVTTPFVVLPWYPHRQGTPPAGYCPPSRVPPPPSRVTPPPAGPGRVPPPSWTWQGTPPRLDLAGYPPCLDLAGYPPPAGPGRVPPPAGPGRVPPPRLDLAG